MELLSSGFLLGASILIVIAAIAFLRARDVFSMTHVVMMSNCYITPLFLIGILIEGFTWSLLGKVIIFIILNIIISNLICYAVLNNASSDKVPAKAELKNL